MVCKHEFYKGRTQPLFQRDGKWYTGSGELVDESQVGHGSAVEGATLLIVLAAIIIRFFF